MRPLRLEVEGFTAFRQPAVVDFTATDLFALVGATGAGKTSVIDAITFALYGTVPRLDDRRAVAPVVSQNLTEARVRLDFSVGPDRYTAVRVVRASKTGASTKEARLQRGNQVIAGTADEVSAAVTEVLGLSYEHFTTCVSLPQGQFARFLHDKPRDRQDLLVRLLDLGLYDLVASTARQRASLAAGRVEVLVGQLERLAGATPEARDLARADVEQLVVLGEQLAKARPQLDTFVQGARDAGDQAEQVARHVEVLCGLRQPQGVAELCRELAEAAATRTVLAAAEEAAAAALVSAEEAVEALPPRTGLERHRDDLRRVVQLQQFRVKGREAARRAGDAVAGAQEGETAAEADRDDRAAHLDRIRLARRAHALVSELALGEPCPVCQHPVDTIPEVHLPDLAAAEQGVAEAGRRLKDAGRSLAEARAEQVRVDEKLAGVETELADITTRLAANAALAGPSPQTAEAPAPDLSTVAQPSPAGAEVAAQIEAVEARIAEVDAAEGALHQARVADRFARQATRDIDRRYDDLVRQETQARRDFDAARDAVAALEPPAIERRDLASDWTALVDWADRRRPLLADELERLRREVADLRAQADRCLAEVVEACRTAGVAVGPDTWPGEAVAAALARAEQTVERIERDIADAQRLQDEAATTTRERQVAEVLAIHLAANRFEKWLLDEAIHRLVERASTILGDLSGGAYALSVDQRSGAFTVIDHANASQPRPARTLSGGETFLASLALALGLADQVAELAAGGVARLEALFLDEGFGTLDADALDVVATALDELGARGRMVGVVTHVRELAERLPVRFEVRKVAGSSTIERVEA